MIYNKKDSEILVVSMMFRVKSDHIFIKWATFVSALIVVDFQLFFFDFSSDSSDLRFAFSLRLFVMTFESSSSWGRNYRYWSRTDTISTFKYSCRLLREE